MPVSDYLGECILYGVALIKINTTLLTFRDSASRYPPGLDPGSFLCVGLGGRAATKALL